MSTTRPSTHRDGYDGPYSMLRSLYGLGPDTDVTWEYWCHTCAAHFDYTDDSHLTEHSDSHGTLT